MSVNSHMVDRRRHTAGLQPQQDPAYLIHTPSIPFHALHYHRLRKRHIVSERCLVYHIYTKELDIYYLAGLFWFGFNTDEDVQLFHKCSDDLRCHLHLLLNVKQQHQWQTALKYRHTSTINPQNTSLHVINPNPA